MTFLLKMFKCFMKCSTKYRHKFLLPENFFAFSFPCFYLQFFDFFSHIFIFFRRRTLKIPSISDLIGENRTTTIVGNFFFLCCKKYIFFICLLMFFKVRNSSNKLSLETKGVDIDIRWIFFAIFPK